MKRQKNRKDFFRLEIAFFYLYIDCSAISPSFLHKFLHNWCLSRLFGVISSVFQKKTGSISSDSRQKNTVISFRKVRCGRISSSFRLKLLRCSSSKAQFRRVFPGFWHKSVQFSSTSAIGSISSGFRQPLSSISPPSVVGRISSDSAVPLTESSA